MQPSAPTPQQPQKSSGGYGKKSIWFWVAIYVVAALIIYGLIYYFFFYKSGTSY